MNLILKAAQFAERAHRGQVRRWTGTPYVYHPMRVAGRAMLLGMEERMVVVAWLHDTIEDCGVTFDGLADKFGMMVAEGVRALTNPSKQFRGFTRPEQKAMDREHLRHAPPLIKNVKALDRIDNLREMTGADPAFLAMYKEESMLLRNAMLDAYTDPELFEELFNLSKAA